ncbi:MAG: hypothetical protein PSV13_06580 [Lacunisphaera sp.]|nr:hypothetical protein [Lacunisphaera sp.]
MRLWAYIIFLAGSFAAIVQAKEPEFGALKGICHVSFPATTQAGPMMGTLGACRLESSIGSDNSLCIVAVYEKEYGPEILKILEGDHSPIMERKDDRISVLYTSGVNTTCVTEFSISSGVAKFLSTEAIAWNESGIYRTSASFRRYSHLLEKRNKPDPKTSADMVHE